MKTYALEELEAELFTPDEIKEIHDGADSDVLEMNLRQLRDMVGMTQVEMAGILEAVQSRLSQIEKGGDYKLSTLRKYVNALGGELRIQAIVGGKTVDLVL